VTKNMSVDGKRGRGSRKSDGLQLYNGICESLVFVRRMLRIVVSGNRGPGWPTPNSWERR